MKETELKPCPFCGGTDLELKDYTENVYGFYAIGSLFICHTNPQEHLGFGKWEEYARIPPKEVTFAEGCEDMLSEENKNAIIEEFKKGQIYWVRVE